MLVDDVRSNARRRTKSAYERASNAPGTARPVAISTDGAGPEYEHLLINSFASERAILDSRGRVIAASDAWSAKDDVTRSDEERDGGGSALNFLSSDPLIAAQISRDLRAILSGERDATNLNFSVRTANGVRHYCLHILPIKVGRSRGAAVFNEDISEIVELQRDKRLLARQLVRSEDNERRRIAREMHDSTLQDLVAIGLTLRRLRHLDDDDVAQSVLGEVRAILSRTQQDVRTLSYLLHPPLLEEGGLPLALSSLIRGLSSRMAIPIEFACHCCGDDVRLPVDVEVALYRVAQEALVNVHKHASATHARVSCTREAGNMVLTVEDDGIGFCGPKRCHVGSGVGINGMRARLAQLGGKLLLSSLREGTRLRAVVPIDWAAL